jgi:ATP-dependent Clp protease ATP-binding subunit ClpA
MFERFTELSRRVVVLAQEEARMLNHNYIGTEHLLLGLIHEEDGIAGRAIVSLGITLEMARDRVSEIIGPGQELPSGHIPFTPRAKNVLELSLREALALKHDYIGTEHILLGLIREADGVGAQILAAVTPLPTVRERVLSLADAAEQDEALTPEWIVPSAQAGGPRYRGGVVTVRTQVVSEFRDSLATIGQTLAALEERLAGIERRLGITPPAPAGEAPAGEAPAVAAPAEAATPPDDTIVQAADETPEESAE